jgi:hypothetical protein
LARISKKARFRGPFEYRVAEQDGFAIVNFEGRALDRKGLS